MAAAARRGEKSPIRRWISESRRWRHGGAGTALARMPDKSSNSGVVDVSWVRVAALRRYAVQLLDSTKNEQVTDDDRDSAMPDFLCGRVDGLFPIV